MQNAIKLEIIINNNKKSHMWKLKNTLPNNLKVKEKNLNGNLLRTGTK